MHSQDYPGNPFAYGLAILRAYAVRAERDPAHMRKFARFNGSMHRALHGEALNDTAFQQCKIKSCPPCHDRRTTEVSDESIEAYGRALDANKGASPHFIIFTGPGYPLAEAPHCVDEAVSSWAALLTCSKYPTGGSGGVKPPGDRFHDERFRQRRGNGMHTPEADDLYAAGQFGKGKKDGARYVIDHKMRSMTRRCRARLRATAPPSPSQGKQPDATARLPQRTS